MILAVFSKFRLIFKSKQYKFIVFAVLVAVLSFSVAQTAEGGILSSLAGFLTASVGQAMGGVKLAEDQQTETNSQNMGLLEPASDNLATSSPQAEVETEITGGSAVFSEAGPMGTVVDIKENQAPSDLISVYTVRPGDTLDEIAQMYNVSVNTLRWSNDIKRGDIIRPGETLTILPITGLKITVKNGDTLKSLAKKYNGNVEEIIAYNNLDLTKGLKVGDSIIIPDGQDGTIVSSAKPGSTLPAKYIGPSYSGYYAKPVANYRRTQGLHGHNAIDMAAPLGTPIYASASGKVIIAKSSGWNGGYGNYLVVSHPNGTQTLYAHLSQLLVSAGDKVSQGEMVGKMGSTGKSTGSHLHFEVRGASNPF
ncbi:MAG: peptidoglycan DD-metalloendopeptidase family protein [Candidatus Paceibacterota bacterium]